jgi:hypothetical protein
MTALRPRRITALGGNEYDLELEGESDATESMRCVVFEHEGVVGVEVEPDLFMTGKVHHVRAVTAAVLAFHRSRGNGSGTRGA